MKEVVRENNAPKRIKHVQFGVLSANCIQEVAEVEVINRELYHDRVPVAHGSLDLHLGVSDKTSTCETCGLKLADCSGHFGVLNLELPVFHVGYFKAIVQLLNCICKECSRVLLDCDERSTFLRRIRTLNASNESGAKATVLRGLFERCRKITKCPWCSAINGSVKKIAPLKLVHERIPSKVSKKTIKDLEDEENDGYEGEISAQGKAVFFQWAIGAYPEMRSVIGRAHHDLNPLVVYELLARIPMEDAELLGFNVNFSYIDGECVGHPKDYIWSSIPIPPSCIRPSVAQENGTNEDDLTIKLTEIIYTNNIIRENLKGNVPFHTIMEDWDFLQLQCAMYIHSEFTGIPASMQFARSTRGFCQRLKGKQGRFRGNLSGKRVDFSARTVISPDPNLRINEVGVPVYVAKILTYPEVVTDFNLEMLKKCVENGPDIHPGANYVQFLSGGQQIKKYLRFGDRKRAAKELKIGDIVERHLMDGDAVLFNRQPSLHKLSIMCHFARVRPWRTFRLNECVCVPYNADFDGDEMNLHLPQTEEARAEAIELMGIKHNLVTPRNGQLLIAAHQDFITAAFLLTNKDVFICREEFCRIVCYMFDAAVHVDLPIPTIQRPAQLWTGKQVFEVLLRPNRKSNIFLNLEAKGRTFQKLSNQELPNEFCSNDGYLLIANSKMISGTLDKSTVGSDSKSSIFYVLYRDYGPDVAITCMTRLSKLAARWIGTRGFSIGINDVQPSASLTAHKESLIRQGYQESDNIIQQCLAGKLAPQPGCTAEQTMEANISGLLSKIRDDCGSLCIKELSRFNSPLIMQWCGSKGSKINVSQMVACVGQQIISGSRIADGFSGRTLPHFPQGEGSKMPAAKGFVRNSFFTGLNPTEFFFHATSGREGLIDTAVKTAETGYMQRRLMKALEDLSAQYDHSIRSSSGELVQFCYGDDGLDAAFMEGEILPVAFDRAYLRSLNNYSSNPDYSEIEGVLQSEQLIPWIEAYLSSVSLPMPNLFLKRLYEFVEKDLVPKLQAFQAKFPSFPKLWQVSIGCLAYFLDFSLSKLQKAQIEPGTAVGAIAAQSIGEPGTQMTLKTFHFAGVASMNVTLGVPRIKEIINAAKSISTPIITAKLIDSVNLLAARLVKTRIEKTLLSQIIHSIDEVYEPEVSLLVININMETIESLQLETNIEQIQQSILRHPRIKLSESQLFLDKKTNKIYIRIPHSYDDNTLSQVHSTIQRLKRTLPNVLVQGIPLLTRAVVNREPSQAYELLIEGYGLREVMTTEGIDGTQTTSNHIIEIGQVLGIEAARHCIMHEIQYTMGKHGMTIDARHVSLLADLMTARGEVLGITRFGIGKMKESVLMLASFERTTDHLFDAALQGKRDDVTGVSECIIMGSPMPVGTGSFRLVQQINQQQQLLKQKSLLFWDNV